MKEELESQRRNWELSRALGMVASGVEAKGTRPRTKPHDWEHEADGNAMGNGPVNLGNGPPSIRNRVGNNQQARKGEYFGSGLVSLENKLTTLENRLGA
jgi:hypothetical protein